MISLTTLPSTLGKAIRTLRTKKGITQSELASRTGLTQGFVSQLEKDTKQPTLDVLENLASALDTPSYMLLYLSQRAQYKLKVKSQKKYRSFYETMFENLDVLSEAVMVLSGNENNEESPENQAYELEQQLHEKTLELKAIKQQLKELASRKTTLHSQLSGAGNA